MPESSDHEIFQTGSTKVHTTIKDIITANLIDVKSWIVLLFFVIRDNLNKLDNQSKTINSILTMSRFISLLNTGWGKVQNISEQVLQRNS